MNEILKKIGDLGIIPVVKIDKAADAVPLAKALIEGGLPLAEITFRTDAAEEAIGNILHGKRIIHIKKLNSEVPWWFNDFVMKLLIYKGDERIQPEDLSEQWARHCLEAEE